MFEDFKKTGKVLFELGLTDSHSGNISTRNGDEILITSRESMLGYLNDEDIVKANIDEHPEDENCTSKDLLIHRMIYNNSSAGAVIHTHGANSLTLSLTENKILAQDAKGQFFFPQGVSILKVRQGATKEEIGKLIVSYMQDNACAVVVKACGMYVWAKTINEALEITTSLEKSSDIWLKSKLLSPRPQPQQQMTSSHHQAPRYDSRKRSAIPPSIGVMDRRTSSFGSRRDIKR